MIEDELKLMPKELEAFKEIVKHHEQYIKDWKKDLISKGMSEEKADSITNSYL